MKIHCDVIRDLLPLYAEDMVSQASRELVEEHIKECEGCRGELETLKGTPLTEGIETRSLKRVSTAIRRRRWLSVMTVFFLLVTLVSGTVMLLDAQVYLSAEEAVKDVWVEGEKVRIRWDQRVIGTGAQTYTQSPGNYAVAAWTNLSKILFPTERIPYDALDEEVKGYITREQYDSMDNTSSYELEMENTNFWYYDLSEDTAELILDGGMPGPAEPLMRDGNRVEGYVSSMAIICITFTAAGMLLDRKWYGQLLIRAAIIAGSCLVSSVIVTAGNLVDVYGRFPEMMVDSTVVMVPMVMCGLCVYELVKLERQDKGL